MGEGQKSDVVQPEDLDNTTWITGIKNFVPDQTICYRSLQNKLHADVLAGTGFGVDPGVPIPWNFGQDQGEFDNGAYLAIALGPLATVFPGDIPAIDAKVDYAIWQNGGNIYYTRDGRVEHATLIGGRSDIDGTRTVEVTQLPVGAAVSTGITVTFF